MYIYMCVTAYTLKVECSTCTCTYLEVCKEEETLTPEIVVSVRVCIVHMIVCYDSGITWLNAANYLQEFHIS